MEKLKRTILLTLTILGLFIGSAKAMDAELAYLTATLFGEAGGEGIIGIQTVASVIVNRRNYYQAHSKGGSIKLSDVCLARWQFSFWNNKRNWTVQSIENWAKSLKGSNVKAWNNCLSVAKQAIAGTMKDVANGATFYYATWMDKKGQTPSWGRTSNYKIVGHHKLIYGVGLSPLKTWHSANSIAGGGGGWDGGLTGGGGDAPGGSSAPGIAYHGYEGYPPECNSATEPHSTIVNNEIMKHRLFAEDVLINMQNMMLKIYKSLSVLFARGHALMCFATKVSPLCLDGNGTSIFDTIKSLVSCDVKIPLLNYFIPGLLIYITGFFMCMSIGMYFVDISFKLGFAVLFLPLTLALWPFPPTQSKFTENVASIISSAMLFAFAAVGTAYAVILINASLGSTDDFWRIMDIASNSKLGDGILGAAEKWWELFNSGDDKKNSMEEFSQAYSISSTNILVILFALVFGFKILASSINNYLNYFFNDGMLGNASSTMHHMGTQAVGFVKNHTVDPAARYARDVAMFQGGKALEGAGNLLAKARTNSKFSSPTPPPAANPAASGIRPSPMNNSTGGGASQNSENTGDEDNDTTIVEDTSVNGSGAENNVPETTNNETGSGQNGGNQKSEGAGNNSGEAQNSQPNSGTQPQNAQQPSTMQKINSFTRPTGHSLTVGNVFKAIKHPRQAYRTIQHLAQQGVQDWQNADSLKDKGKLVLKSSGQVVMRSVRGNATEAASAAVGVTSGFLRSMGQKMQSKPAQWQKERQNRKSGGNIFYDEQQEREQEEQYQREQEEINNSYHS